MRVLQLNSYGIASFSVSSHFNNKARYLTTIPSALRFRPSPNLCIISRRKIKVAASAKPENAIPDEPQEEAMVKFAFVHSVLFPDGTPDVQYRKACGGQKLRDIMLDNHVELYGPYSRPLLNCGGSGTCGTCLVEVVEGKQLFTPKTEKEKEKLRRKPRTWRLACQTTVGTPESRGMVVIQQLPDWKGHEWDHKKIRQLEGEGGEAAWPWPGQEAST